MAHVNIQKAKDDQMLSTQIVQCPSCAGALAYEPGKAEITCSNCSNVYSFEEAAPELKYTACAPKLVKKFENCWESAELDSIADHMFTVYRSECKTCGGTIDNKLFVAGKCPSCGNAYQVSFSDVEAGIEPQAIFPFETFREDVLRKFRHWYRFSIHRILFFMRLKFDKNEEIAPYYYPVWMFNAKAKVSYKGEMTPSPTSEKREVTGEFEAEIERFPVHALLSSEHRLASYFTKYLEWNLESPKKFNPALIAGMRAKPYFHDAESVMPVASQAMSEHVDELVKKDMGGAHQEINEVNAQYSEISCTPVLLPVWMAVTTCKGKPVWFCMNGMSGKYIARSPSPEKKQVWLFGIFFAALFTGLAGYLQQNAGILNAGTIGFAAVFSIFSVSALLAGLQKVFSIKMSLWLAAGVDLFYLFISLKHIKVMMWYHVAVFALIGLILLLWRLSSSDSVVDESEFQETDLEKLQ